MGNKFEKILYVVGGIILGAIALLCVYYIVVAIPEKREAERLAIEEQRKKWEQEDAEVSSGVTVVPDVTGSEESEKSDTSGTEDDVTSKVTESPTITDKPTATGEPTLTPVANITESPKGVTNVPTAKPTKAESKVTDAPTATVTPTEAPAKNPSDSQGSVTPTATPMPIVLLKAKVQMGDDVWYEFYEKGVLIVTGTGSTWDFNHTSTLDEHFKKACYEDGMDYVGKTKTYETITKIIVSEGITRLGNFSMSLFERVESITLPKSLKVIGESAFRYFGNYVDSVDWIGLNLEGIDIATTAFYDASGLEELKNVEKYQIKPTATPTPLPPTPTPTPDPANPKLKHTQQMGDNVTYEFWDNGILYIKGSGAIWDVSYDTVDITKAKKVIVEEGITYLGSCSLMFDFEELILPKSIVEIHRNLGTMAADNVIIAYKDGEKVSYTCTEVTSIGQYLRNEIGIKVKE